MRWKEAKAVAIGLMCSALILSCSRYEPVPRPDIHLNDKPEEKYKVTISSGNLPRQALVRAEAVYEIESASKCVPIDSRRSLGGSRPFFQHQIELPVRRASDMEYEAIFYKDAIRNEDYYGIGVCRWAGFPVYKIHWMGSVYNVFDSASMKRGDTEVVMACERRPSHFVGMCRNEEYEKNANPGTHFYVTITAYKE